MKTTLKGWMPKEYNYQEDFANCGSFRFEVDLYFNEKSARLKTNKDCKPITVIITDEADIGPEPDPNIADVDQQIRDADEAEVCEWRRAGCGDFIWYTDCNNRHVLSSSYKFCPFCGKKIKGK